MTRELYSPRKSSPVNNVAKKASSTKAKSSTATEKLDVTKNISTSIRQIENGFLVSESGYVGKGRNQKWVNKEFFSPTNPVAGIKIKFGKR